MADIPKEIEERLRPHLAAIARLFKAPRITLIVRAPEIGNVTGDLVLSNDNPTRAIAALRSRMVAEAEIYAGAPNRMTAIVKEPSSEPPAARMQMDHRHFQPRAARRPLPTDIKEP